MGSGRGGPDVAVATDCAARVLAIASTLRSSWRRLSPANRDALLGEVVSYADLLRETLDAPTARPRGPAPDEIAAQLESPTSEVHLQAIVWLPTKEVVGFEALTRFPAWPPDRWFRRAWTAGVGLEFDLLAVARALPVVADLPPDVYLAVNVAPLTLISSDLVDLLAGAEPGRLVLELTEHDSIADYPLYRRRLRHLRKLGVRIAVDDAGSGHASLRHIIQLGPDVIKLDRALTANCDKDPVRRALLRSLATFASDTKTCLIAEGVETTEEAEALVSHGVAFAQGYLFGRPERSPRLTVSPVSGGWLLSDSGGDADGSGGR